jgi:aldose 1-epimerase
MVSAMMLGLLLSQAVQTREKEMEQTRSALPAGIAKSDFGKTKERAPVELYTLTNAKGMKAKIMTYGAIVTELIVPDGAGKLGDVILGFDNLGQYFGDHPYFGAIVGRVGNRIAKGRFALHGATYTLAANNGPNHLHGGLKGFDKKIWQAEPMESADGPALKLTYLSKDGEEGYPGNLTSTVIYTVTGRNELKIDTSATTDKATPVNLTHHAYFNLEGPGSGDVLGHEVTMAAERYTPVDDTLIPTGEIAGVKGTPMDFTKPATIGSRIAQVKGGYDHNYVISMEGAKTPVFAVRVREPRSRRIMEVLTTQPGVQFYTGNFLDGSLKGIGGAYKKHYGFCLETQHFPDSVNQPKFPTTILEPGKTYHHTTIYRFSAE